ncbi:carboxypeptidase-like regulatory domain-containing protein [Nocardioides sp. TF02-7]|uniref:carboxypeptidase-like regulatory domain-containing protein n=1 Tax=Nocardioides sp. TF02-7 TaxID=2917724 RepID=UPI001F061194|nr:carboxypeptidase-like regulatory domain-containing protein [Nocardioides sp. TF02-7]UMG92413.1 carboxypeptidase-like regulatory domain-containing protein [Nocardioides sp. TF02-7]
MLTVARALVALLVAAAMLAVAPAHATGGQEPVVVTGRVVDRAGTPVPDVAILAELSAGRWVEVGRADDHGDYRVELDLDDEDDQDGPVYLGVGLLGDLHYYGANLVGDGAPYRPGAVHDMDLVVPELAEVSGTVSDPSGNPVPGATVAFADLEVRKEGSLVTDDAGQYRVRLLPGATFRVQVEADGFRVLDRDVDLPAPGPQTWDWTLAPAGPQSRPAGAPAESTADEGRSLGRSPPCSGAVPATGGRRCPDGVPGAVPAPRRRPARRA